LKPKSWHLIQRAHPARPQQRAAADSNQHEAAE
jgi:hypothetical protein